MTRGSFVAPFVSIGVGWIWLRAFKAMISSEYCTWQDKFVASSLTDLSAL